jgi:hypothetical protein
MLTFGIAWRWSFTLNHRNYSRLIQPEFKCIPMVLYACFTEQQAYQCISTNFLSCMRGTCRCTLETFRLAPTFSMHSGMCIIHRSNQIIFSSREWDRAGLFHLPSFISINRFTFFGKRFETFKTILCRNRHGITQLLHCHSTGCIHFTSLVNGKFCCSNSHWTSW